ncbi:MAG: GHKL domain-containing protein [Flavobacteriales bacterium]|nr:GHKL domain-containing protein [Flavobacteriales bacterium]
MKNKSYLFLFAGLALLFGYSIISFFQNTDSKYQKFADKLNEKQQQVLLVLESLLENDNNRFFYQEKELVNLNKEEGISFYVFEANKLISWTNSTAPFISIDDFTAENGILLLKNGWYQYYKIKKKSTTYLGLILIKNQYTIQNNHINSGLHKSFGINDGVDISLQRQDQAKDIKDEKGNRLFSIKITTINYQWSNVWVFFTFFLGFVMMVLFVYWFCKQHRRLKKYTVLLSMLFVLSFYVFSVLFSVPQNFYHQKIFSPTIFGQSNFLPSLGHFLYTALTILLLTILWVKQLKNNTSKNNIIKAVLFIVFISVLNILFTNWFQGLISNSNINFDVNFFLDLSVYSFVGIIIVMILYVCLVVLINYGLIYFTSKQVSRTQLLTVFWVVALLSILLSHLISETDWKISAWILLALLIFAISKTNKIKFYQTVLLMLLITTTITVGFVKFTKEKELLNQEFLIKKLSKEVDPITEYLFEDLTQKIKNDTFIVKHIQNYWDKKDEIDSYIIEKYFSGYWNKYDVFPYLCTDEDTLIVQPENGEVGCVDFFNSRIENEAVAPNSFNKNIQFLYNTEGVGSYLGNIVVKSPDTSFSIANLFIELWPKLLSNSEGYPELLLNEKEIGTTVNLTKYSFAKYKKGKLVNTIGEFNFSIELTKNLHFNDAGYLIQHSNNQHHLYYQSDKNTVVILSSIHKTFFDYLTTFSYFFICCSIFILILGLMSNIEPFNWRIALTDFSTKIQFFIIVSTFLSFVMFGLGTSYYIEKQNVEKNIRNLQEKLQTIVAELNTDFGDKETFEGVNPDFITNYLIKYSNIFYADINLYDVEGKLIATSRPEIIERGLISNRINPHAYQSLIFQKKSSFIHDESIGNMNYLSAYVPFRNVENQVIAYLNLPYFAKQNQLEKELSQFFTALINIYALLFLVSIFIAVAFANYISEPVRLIKNKISALQFGSNNELIEWHSNDEIGGLVSEYNKKVLELEKSAELLAKSERESAWREMAKQVAHEIKNPLTPMKLSIQHLERSVADNPTDLPDRIKRTAKILIEQIDTLTNIANEFSSFAKMPKANEQEFNLIEILESIVDLYKEEQVELVFENQCKKHALLIADKDQLNRMFSNLIKNAIQAIPENQQGKIEIITRCDKTHYTITITDNGTGIPAELHDKIFTPNFTTKTTGMGLGLAMVKNIVENINGSISFATGKNGTCFTIIIPFRETNV